MGSGRVLNRFFKPEDMEALGMVACCVEHLYLTKKPVNKENN